MTERQPPTSTTADTPDAVSINVPEPARPTGLGPDADQAEPTDPNLRAVATDMPDTGADDHHEAPGGDHAAPADQAEAGEAEPDDPAAAAERERDEYLDALRRKQAEFENFRKRMAREGASQRIAGHAEVAGRLLDVLDDFERTLDAAGEVDPGFLKGVTLVHDKLVNVLGDFGLTRIDDPGEPFDPNRHEAVQQVEAEQPTAEPTVLQVLRPGYDLSGRVLRAAMVVVEQ